MKKWLSGQCARSDSVPMMHRSAGILTRSRDFDCSIPLDRRFAILTRSRVGVLCKLIKVKNNATAIKASQSVSVWPAFLLSKGRLVAPCAPAPVLAKQSDSYM